ncbi:MAG: type II toxin-antitoxin system VapC family toxin, partial [Rhodospirillaceae bacterium]|nr:type II toxin-antitoxin system VapC family toxin [Rhodospirillaceae bacterium]
MVVLDTNVVSELMLDTPNSSVLSWVDGVPALELFVTAVTEAEIRTGIAFLPEGARRRDLLYAAERTLGLLFAGR